MFFYQLDQITLKMSSLLGPSKELDLPDRATVTGGDLTSVMNVVYVVAGVVAIIIIIVAGILYSLSSGDPGKASKAKNAIIYSVVGLVVVLSAYAIMNFVVGRF